jgi:hypothetical protein
VPNDRVIALARAKIFAKIRHEPDQGFLRGEIDKAIHEFLALMVLSGIRSADSLSKRMGLCLPTCVGAKI